MESGNLPTKRLKIEGMHCPSCEVLIERQLKKVEGIESARVDHLKGEAEITCSCEPDLKKVESAIRQHGYSLFSQDRPLSAARNPKRHYAEIGAIFIIFIGVFLLLKRFGLAPNIGVSDTMSYGFVFVIGLVAAMSTCLAVTGGLLLAVGARFNAAHPNLTRMQKFRPHIYFNAGRIISYTVFGGLLGFLGSIIAPSVFTTGILTILASAVMILLGLQMLNIFPWLTKFQPKMPKFVSHFVYGAAEKKSVPFALGASTFFLPCGFTQALQLYVLSKGGFVTGALVMLAFSLGTLPALVSLGAFASLAKGKVQNYFVKASAVLVIMLGIFSIPNGLALTGVDASIGSVFGAKIASAESAALSGGKQVVNMKVVGLDYYPANFDVLQGVPVEWHIDGSQAQGCAKVITVPKLGITEYLPAQGEKVITFTPEETGKIGFSCTMGMTTRGASFNVLPNENKAASQTALVPPAQEKCNPEIMDCNVQKLYMEVSNERGFYPNTFTIKKDIPVELEIDAKVQLGGCMGTMVIPDYDVAQPIRLGKNILKFTPTKEGTVQLTCSMGSTMGKFVVTA